MAYTRRRTMKKRTYKKKTYTRPRRAMVVRRTPSNQVHSFKRMLASPAAFTGSAVYAPLTQANSFNLGLLQGSADFAALYDQYRINFIVAKFWLKIDPGAQSAAGASYPKFYWYRDYDDDTFPSSLNEMRENSKTKVVVMNPNRPITIAFKPNVLQTIYSSAVGSNYKPVFNQWLDMSVTNTKHYGFKWCIDDLTNTNYTVTPEFTYYIQCRQPR